MNIRRIIYIAAIIIIAFLLFRGFEGNTSLYLTGPEPLAKNELLADFKSPKFNSIKFGNPEQIYKISAVLFPENFKGEAGDTFYAEMKNEQNYLTIMYLIVETDGNGEKDRLEYIQKDVWESIKLPVNKFETYYWENNNWQKAAE